MCAVDSLKDLAHNALNTRHDIQLSQTKDWYRETIVANQKSPRLLHNDSLSSVTAEYHTECLGLKSHSLGDQTFFDSLKRCST